MIDVIDSFPPTPTQEGMLATALRDPHRGVEIEQLIVRFGERVDAARLRDGFLMAQTRFQALRSAFRWEGERTEQVVVREAPLPFEEVELELDEASIEAFLEDDRRRGFEIVRAPLFRATVLRGNEDVLVFTFHHVILDGRSYRAVLEHVLDHLDRRATAFAASESSFGDYCRAIAGRDFAASRAYFAELLKGASTTPLPLRESGSRAKSGVDAKRREATLTVPDISALVALGTAHGPSVANAVQAAWAWVLARSARIDDVVIGTTRAGRVRWIPRVDEVVGCLIDTLPIRITVDESAPPRALLESVHAMNVALREHEHVPLTEVLTPAGISLSSLVVVERYDLQPSLRARGGADARRRFSLREQSDFPLVLAAYQDETRLRLVLEYDEDELDPEAADRLLARVARALEQLGHGTEEPLAALDLFVGDEEEKLRAWARGKAADLRNEPARVPARFEDVVRARRAEIAVEDASGDHASYEALHAGARRIAAALAQVGTRRADVVLVVLPRSIRWVASLWGVWLADAVYVPIDPAWPDARLSQVHDEIVGAGLVRPLVALVDASTRSRVERALPETRIVDLEAAWEHEPTRATVDEGRSSSDGQSLAYLLFTSGTTGKPKGTRISHRALAAHAAAAIDAFGLGRDDRVLQFTGLGFDVSLEEVVPSLLAGARVVLRSESASGDLDVFCDEIERAEVTVLNLPSAFLHELLLHLERVGRRFPKAVRLVLVGGERLSPETYSRYRALHPRVRLVNAYGPTEATITSVACEVFESGVPADGRTEIPIGRAFGACRAHVVAGSNGRARLAAIEEPGELWLAGPQVANGYLGMPEASARAFVPDPFAMPDDVDRIAYRTGDLVKTNARGELVFLGRIDRQIKLRGHRIEPSEIEDALQRHEGVESAVVVLAGEAEARALVAFVTATGGSIDTDALRGSLSRTLPSAMVPSAIAVLDALPKTVTGKLDREQLRVRADVTLRSRQRASLPSEPRNDLEAWLMPVFAEVLRRDQVDVDQSFFDLGGHSLLALRLLARLRSERPDLPLTLAALFANPSVRGLARSISEAPNEAVPTLVRLNLRSDEIEHETPLFCVCGVQLYGALARAMQDDRPVFGAFLPVETRAASDATTSLDVPSMAAGYIRLIQRQRPHGPYLLAGESFGGLLAYEMAQQLVSRGEEVRMVALFDSILPRAFTRAPLAERAITHLRELRRDPSVLVAAARRRTGRVVSRLRAALGMPDESVPVAEIRDEVFKNAGEAYDPVVRPYAGRVLVFRARGGLGYEGETVRWDLGWSGLVRDDTPVHGIEGTHLGILQEPGASQIALVIRGELSS